MAKQVFDFRPGKGFTVAQSNEHQRRWTEKGWQSATHSGNYDRTRSALNFEVVRGGKVQPIDKSHSIPELMAMNLQKNQTAKNHHPHRNFLILQCHQPSQP